MRRKRSKRYLGQLVAIGFLLSSTAEAFGAHEHPSHAGERDHEHRDVRPVESRDPIGASHAEHRASEDPHDGSSPEDPAAPCSCLQHCVTSGGAAHPASPQARFGSWLPTESSPQLPTHVTWRRRHSPYFLPYPNGPPPAD